MILKCINVYGFSCFTVDKTLPPKLEPSASTPLVTNSENLSEPPALKPMDLSPEKCQRKIALDGKMISTSLLNGLSSDLQSSDLQPSENSIMVATSTLTEPAGTINRRTAVLFRKSKSMSPQKPVKTGDASVDCPQLGTKTFLSVVIPRLETLLQHRKRAHSGDSQDGGKEECSAKRFNTGMLKEHALISTGKRSWGGCF